MQLISKFNDGLRFLLRVIDIYSKYVWVIPLKDKKGIIISNAFQKILDKSHRISNKIWVDQGSEFYNRSMKSWLQDNDIEIYSTYNKEKSVVTERLIRFLKNKIYKYMRSVSKNVYIDKLDDIVNKYSNTYNSTIKMNPVDFGIESNDKGPKFKVGNHVRISKCKNIFAKGYVQNWSEEVFVINAVLWAYDISDLNSEKNVGTFYEKELQKINQTEFRD